MPATFQPEGGGLGSAENPLAPEVGDLRITWRAFKRPPLADRLELRDGKWTLRETTATPTAVESEAQPVQPQPRRWPTWLLRSEEHTSELQSLMRISYAVFCLKKKNQTQA